MTALEITSLALLLALCSCGGGSTALPVADRDPRTGLHPVPDAQAFAPGPVEPAAAAPDVDTWTQVGGGDSPGAPTPEPASIALLAAGLGVLVLVRRRRRA